MALGRGSAGYRVAAADFPPGHPGGFLGPGVTHGQAKACVMLAGRGSTRPRTRGARAATFYPYPVANGESRPYLGGGGCRGHGSEAFGLGRPRAFERAALGFGQMAGSRFCILGFGRRKSEKSKTDVSHLLMQGADGPRSGLSRERTRVPVCLLAVELQALLRRYRVATL
ncbi:uncharacterized protein PG998_005568 [Apiospora kogelbergensis]|uniref:uncharacterized protein n=1 Tax=Apiospora kogelbergensis TaxID=1337665 RepID=UPI00312D26BC